MFYKCSVSIENILKCAILMAFKQKHPIVEEKFKLLNLYEKENVSTHALADKFRMGRIQATDLIENKDTILEFWKFHNNDQL